MAFSRIPSPYYNQGPIVGAPIGGRRRVVRRGRASPAHMSPTRRVAEVSKIVSEAVTYRGQEYEVQPAENVELAGRDTVVSYNYLGSRPGVATVSSVPSSTIVSSASSVGPMVSSIPSTDSFIAGRRSIGSLPVGHPGSAVVRDLSPRRSVVSVRSSSPSLSPRASSQVVVRDAPTVVRGGSYYNGLSAGSFSARSGYYPTSSARGLVGGGYWGGSGDSVYTSAPLSHARVVSSNMVTPRDVVPTRIVRPR